MSAAPETLVGLCTCPDRASADRLADMAVGGGHAACVNIVPGLTSVYRWQGELCRDQELLLVMKTTREAWPGLEATLREAHPYELPELIAVPVVAGLPGYLRWVVDAVSR